MLNQTVQDSVMKMRAQQADAQTSLFTHGVANPIGSMKVGNHKSAISYKPIGNQRTMMTATMPGRVNNPSMMATLGGAQKSTTSLSMGLAQASGYKNVLSSGSSTFTNSFKQYIPQQPPRIGVMPMGPAPLTQASLASSRVSQLQMFHGAGSNKVAQIPSNYSKQGLPMSSFGARNIRMSANTDASEKEILTSLNAIPALLTNPLDKPMPLKRVMCCNRGEIAIRVFRACKENGITSVGIFSEQDKMSLARYKCDESYQVAAKNGSPVGAYLAIDEIVEIAKKNNCDAIHPGYGFLSENSEFARKCRDNDIVFIGPDPESIDMMGDKTAARRIATECGVPVIPGTDDAIATKEEAFEWCKTNGLPVMMKASMGGGGRGMRVVRKEEEIMEAFERCSSEALTAFGDGSMFIEKLVEQPRHIEVQILADKTGNTIHLYDRDCSVQRRHQKVVEIAPASGIDPELRQKMFDSAIKLCKHIKYKNAGTVEFLLENDGSAFYFIEVNPRVQVEHTVTEETTGIDIVQTQILIAGGATLEELGIEQERIYPSGYAIQCRVTTEDPKEGFKPDTGRIGVFRSPGGLGIRLDGQGHQGMVVSPYYDSLLTKVIAKGRTYKQSVQKLYRALDEFRIRGVKTNIPFVKNVLAHPDFYNGTVNTSFIDATPELFDFDEGADTRLQRIIEYLGEMAVNGNTELNPSAAPITYRGGIKPELPVPPVVDVTTPPPDGWRQVLLAQGPKGFAKAVRNHEQPLVMDTTWRDAHQSLLATRVRTQDLEAIAPATARCLPNAFSLEMWGGATFDVSMRFLKEDPWTRLRKLRAEVPNVPFQMLLRGANAVGYTSYADNTVKEFCKEAVREGIDIFRVFDSLNYIENMKFGIEAAREAGGVVEATICYTGDVLDTNSKYNMLYYVNKARELVACGTDILGIKDMAGLMRPEAATMLVGTLRKEFPDVPIHVHTHDTAGTGAASMLAAVKAGADIVDGSIDCLSNATSQPALGTLDALMGHIIPDKELYGKVNDYWMGARKLYAPFETGTMASATDVYVHEMPGGQVTNLRFQAEAVGLGDQWDDVKKTYAIANKVLGDIVKVTPSSKVVGDLALFMVQNGLDAESVVEQAEKLDFPDSVISFMNGRIGVPSGGFPEPFRTRVLKGKKPEVPDGKRPGEMLPPLDFAKEQTTMSERYARPFIKAEDFPPEDKEITDYLSHNDILSAALYPDVHRDFVNHLGKYGDTSAIPTPQFFSGMQEGEEITFVAKNGREQHVKLVAIGQIHEDGTRRVFFEVNGLQNSFDVLDRTSDVAANLIKKEKVDTEDDGQVGSAMKGLVVDVLKSSGDLVEEGEPLAVMSAMKMETIISAPKKGRIERIAVKTGDDLDSGDLIAVIR